MKPGDEMDLVVEGAAVDGKTVARSDGMVIFVKGAAPGDGVRARIGRVKKSFAEATVVRVTVPSPVRTLPRCSYFGICGGCTWQHVAYEAQLDFKRRQVRDALERIGGFRDIAVNPVLGSEKPYWYRNKMEFSFGDPWYPPDEWEERHVTSGADAGRTFALGLHIPGRYDKVLDLEECWLQSETSVAIVNAIRGFARANRLAVYSPNVQTGYLRNLVLRTAARTGELMVNLVTGDDRPDIMTALRDELVRSFPGITTIVNNITRRLSSVALGEIEKVYHGPGTITEQIGKRVYRISANSFFQTNTVQAEVLYETARRLAALTPGDVVYDLYSGTGTIALHVADDVRMVVGIEAAPSAVEDAKRNAAMNNVANCVFMLGDLKDSLTKNTGWRELHGSPDVVIVDPPRAGMHEKVIRELRHLSPRRIVYISCNPATQARDLKLLCQDGVYTPGEIQPVDMFPHTSHVECVAEVCSRTPAV